MANPATSNWLFSLVENEITNHGRSANFLSSNGVKQQATFKNRSTPSEYYKTARYCGLL